MQVGVAAHVNARREGAHSQFGETVQEYRAVPSQSIATINSIPPRASGRERERERETVQKRATSLR